MTMTTTSNAKQQSKRATRGPAVAPDALKLLTKDHADVKKLFKQFDQLASRSDIDGKAEIANRICMELLIHTQVEEELFYPVARDVLDAADMMNEASVEHDSAKSLIAQIQDMDPEDAMYDAKVTVLGEYIRHHVKEEEKEMFPKMKKADCDLEALGEKIAARKRLLQRDFMKLDGSLSETYLKRIAARAQVQH